jgi:hypothetical protein
MAQFMRLRVKGLEACLRLELPEDSCRKFEAIRAQLNREIEVLNSEEGTDFCQLRLVKCHTPRPADGEAAMTMLVAHDKIQCLRHNDATKNAFATLELNASGVTTDAEPLASGDKSRRTSYSPTVLFRR